MHMLHMHTHDLKCAYTQEIDLHENTIYMEEKYVQK